MYLRIEIPQSKQFVPRRGEGELAIARDSNIRNKIVVTGQPLLGFPVTSRGVILGQLPANQRLV